MNKVIIAILLLSCSFAGAKEKQKRRLEKIPKSLFLVKKTQIGVDVGEPQFYPGEAQLRTIINDPTLHQIQKYE